MAKKKHQIISTRVAGTAAERELQHLKHKDLQRACVGRGIPFEDAVNFDIPALQSWFCKNFYNGQNIMFLNDYDAWKDEQLRMNGHEKGDPVFHPSLRLGFIGSRDDAGNVSSTKKPRLKSLIGKEKPKRERLEGTKIFSGTKKAMTWELTKAKLDLKTITKRVMEKFPEAKAKSISIWHKRALNEGKAKK
jgi:hypothetical protein